MCPYTDACEIMSRKAVHRDISARFFSDERKIQGAISSDASFILRVRENIIRSG